MKDVQYERTVTISADGPDRQCPCCVGESGSRSPMLNAPTVMEASSAIFRTPDAGQSWMRIAVVPGFEGELPRQDDRYCDQSTLTARVNWAGTYE
jgi:hypothetical protein